MNQEASNDQVETTPEQRLANAIIEFGVAFAEILPSLSEALESLNAVALDALWESIDKATPEGKSLGQWLDELLDLASEYEAKMNQKPTPTDSRGHIIAPSARMGGKNTKLREAMNGKPWKVNAGDVYTEKGIPLVSAMQRRHVSRRK